jgi:hypothetical protein
LNNQYTQNLHAWYKLDGVGWGSLPVIVWPQHVPYAMGDASTPKNKGMTGVNIILNVWLLTSNNDNKPLQFVAQLRVSSFRG